MSEEIKFEITSDIETTLVDMTKHYAHIVKGEYGLLYLKLKRWYKKYGNFPTYENIKKISYYINIDETRVRTKVRTTKGELTGKGVGSYTVSFDAELEGPNSDNTRAISEVISDPTDPLPNEIERFNLKDFLNYHGDLNDSEKQFLKLTLEGYDHSYIAETLNVTISRISQLKQDLFGRLRKSYLEYSSPTREEGIFKNKTITELDLNPYAKSLVKKKEEREKLRIPPPPIKRSEGYTLNDYDLENQATDEFTSKIYEEFKRSNLTLRQICKKYRVSYGSFRQKAYKLSLPFAELNRQKEDLQRLAVCEEWENYNGPMKLRSFCKVRGYNYPNVINWLKKKNEMESKWYCLRTKVKREHIIAANLTKAENIDTFAPQITINRQTVNGKKKFTEPMFPGYLFVRFNLKNFRKISQFPGITGAVKLYEKYPEIPSFVIDNLKKDVQARGIETKESFEEGDLVEILEGSFKGLCTKVYRPDIGENRVALLIEMLGKFVQINVKRNQIEKVA